MKIDIKKKFSFINYKFYGLIQIVYFLLLKVFYKKNDEKIYNFYYDFTFVNANYDFIVFLIVAAIKSKNKKARIYFLFKSKFANVRNKEKKIFGEEYQYIKFKNIILKLAKSIKDFNPEIIIVKNRNAAKKIYLLNKFNFPKYNIIKNGRIK